MKTGGRNTVCRTGLRRDEQTVLATQSTWPSP